MRIFAITLLALVTSSLALADEAVQLSKLLDQEQRPSMSEISQLDKLLTYEDRQRLRAVAQKVEGDSRNNRGHIHFDHWLGVLQSTAPRMIARLEKAFPGATFAFMGRDTQLLADIFESFYDSLGQPGRIARLGMSKASFVGTSSATLVDFLEANGFSLDRVGVDHPYILVDTVSSGGGRQGRMLIQAVYSEYLRRGGDAIDLIRLFNMAGLVVSTFNQQVNSIDISENTLLDQEQYYRKYGPPRAQYGKVHSIMHYLDVSGKNGNEAGYDHFTGAWHESYGAMKLDDKGNVIAIRGQPTSREMREAIVYLQLLVQQTGSSAAFFDWVNTQAREIGYEFWKSRPSLKRRELRPILAKYPENADQLDRYLTFYESFIDLTRLSLNSERILQNIRIWSQRGYNLREQVRQFYEQDVVSVDPNLLVLAHLEAFAQAIMGGMLHAGEIGSFKDEIASADVSTSLVKALKKLFKVAPSMAEPYLGDTADLKLMKGTVHHQRHLTLLMALNGFDAISSRLCEAAFDGNDVY